MKFYINKSNPSIEGIFIKKVVLNKIRNENLNIIFPTDLDDEVIDYFGYASLELRILNPWVEDSPYRGELEFINIYEEGNRWVGECSWLISEEKINKVWKEVRDKRDKLLQETDWIMSSEIHSKKIKDQYRLYRQLLRDSINVHTDPKDIIFPTPPYMLSEASIRLKKVGIDREEMDDELFNKIRDREDSSGSWRLFIEEWGRGGLVRDKEYVRNLMKYCGVSKVDETFQ